MTPRRAGYVRPIKVAVSFTLAGEMLIFLVWGLYLFPQGSMWVKFLWTGACGVAMGAVIGVLVGLAAAAGMGAKRPALWSGTLYFGVLSFCTFLCFRIDWQAGGYFGAREAPALFLAGGLLPALATCAVYAWLLHSKSGNALLTRFGY